MMRKLLALAGRHERWLWIALVLAIVVIRWPFLKGMYYRTTGASAVDRIAWRSDLDAALAEARQTGRPVLVDFTASWCPPCAVMKHDVWPDTAVAAAVERGYVPLAIDVDHDGGISDRFGVETIPTLLVLDPRGQVVRRAGYLPVSGMLRFLAVETP